MHILNKQSVFSSRGVQSGHGWTHRGILATGGEVSPGGRGWRGAAVRGHGGVSSFCGSQSEGGQPPGRALLSVVVIWSRGCSAAVRAPWSRTSAHIVYSTHTPVSAHRWRHGITRWWKTHRLGRDDSCRREMVHGPQAPGEILGGQGAVHFGGPLVVAPWIGV